MTKSILYALDQEKRATTKLKPINGKIVQLTEKSLPFNIENVEIALEELFGEIAISENEWSRKQGRPSYDISIEVQGRQTMEQIQTYLHSKFQRLPLGGNRNFADVDKINLFLYYQVGSETFHLKFSNVISPYQNE